MGKEMGFSNLREVTMPRHTCSQCGGKLSSAAAECPRCAHPSFVKEAKWHPSHHIAERLERIFVWGGIVLILISLGVMDRRADIGTPIILSGFLLFLIGKLFTLVRTISAWIRSRRIR